MRILPTTLALLLFASGAIAQTIRQADTLSPEDIGATKFTFESQAAPQQVIVFRRDKYLDGKLVERYDVVSNERAKMQVKDVVLLDLSVLSGGRMAGYTLRSPMLGVVNINEAQLRTSGHSENPPTADFEFQGAPKAKSGNQKFVFTILNESYSDAKRRIPELPAETEKSSSWTYLHLVDLSKQ